MKLIFSLFILLLQIMAMLSLLDHRLDWFTAFLVQALWLAELRRGQDKP